MIKHPRIVLLGGGTGSFALLQGIKELTSNITAVVSMSDDGGSTGVLRDELGVLPPGDVRQCLVALSDLAEVRDLFSYRFNQGSLEGQSLGNMILSGLELQYGSFEDAIRIAGELLHTRGSVVPVTLQPHTLVGEDQGKVYRGEHIMDGAIRLSPDTVLRLDPVSPLNPAAAIAIHDADMVVLAPGSLYTSLIPLLVVSGMAEALSTTRALVISVANLINKPLQTDGWHVVDYVKQFERYIGKDSIDAVLYNDQPISASLLHKYADEGELPIDIAPYRFNEVNARSVGARLISAEIVENQPNATIRRAFIRHDGTAVAKQLTQLLI